MKDNKYMENIDELMKFVFEGRLLGVDAQAERRRLQELKSYGILEEDNDICKCYKQIINLLNDNKEYILNVLYKKNKKFKEENRLEAIPREIEYYYALIKNNKYEGYLNDAKELSSIYHKYIEITMPSDDLTKDNYQINLVLNDKLTKLLNDLNALERKIDLSIKKQERQEFYQSRISTLDEELAVDKLDTGYDSKSLKRTLKK